MRSQLQVMLCIVCVLLNYTWAEAQVDKAPQRRVSGIEQRVAWTGSHIRGTPDPPLPYTTTVAFPKLKFYEPLELTPIPGTTRMAVAERPGKVYTFDTSGSDPDKRLLLDTQRSTYGVALHPQFQQNGYVFVSAERPGTAGQTGTIQVLRYQTRNDDRLSVDPATEKIVISWPADGHRGGCLRFGPDGFLYISVGDGSGIADQLETGQDLSDLLGSILRIDVDHSDGDLPYAVPTDNPFVATPHARGEVFSYGHRQVWKFSFDTRGRLWGGEVGQDLWEMIYIVQKGGNYGWSVREGRHPFRPDRPQGPTPLLDPLVEHNHDHFRSITGGYFYHTSSPSPLNDHYIYGDYDTGRVWALRYPDEQVKDHRELADTQLRIVAFGKLPSGEVLLLDFPGGQLHRLVPQPPRKDLATFPGKLSETGLFASTADHQPAPGLIPYSVNSPLWSDGAEKQRFIALPGNAQIEFDAVTYPQPAPGAQPGWRFPDGTVLVKTFSLDLEEGNPASRRRLETRILHHERMPGNDDEYGNQVWRGYTYVWNDEQTDADLLGAEALDRTFTIRDPAEPGGRRELTWHFPSRADCTLCHTMSAKYVLGVNTLQMNKDHDYGGVIANQLSTLEHLGVFHKKLPKRPVELPRIVDYRAADEPLNLRARAYLHANCAHCHRKWGGGNAEFQLLASLPLDETGTIGAGPQQGRFDLQDPRLLVPGEPERSMTLFRMRRLGLGRMPHVASNRIDRQATELVSQWIKQLANGDDLQHTGLVPADDNKPKATTDVGIEYRKTTYVYKRVADLEIKADVHRPADEVVRPVVVWIHGGALINGHREGISGRVLQMARESGYVLVSIDYRLAPETPLPQVIRDVEDAIAWIREQGPRLYKADPRRMVVMGGSAGGYLTLTVGHRVTPRPTALVAFWGYGDLVGEWYSRPSPHARHQQIKMTREEAFRQVSGKPISDSRDRQGNGGAFYQYCRQHGLWPKAVSGWDPDREPDNFVPFMPVRNVGPDYPPTLLIHGTADTDVPFEQSAMMAEALKKAGVEHQLLSVPHGEHGLVGADPDLIDAAYLDTHRFLRRKLEGK